jgi:hypothetical protein
LIAPWFTLGIYLQAHDELLVYVDSIDASQEHAVTVNSFIIFFNLKLSAWESYAARK